MKAGVLLAALAAAATLAGPFATQDRRPEIVLKSLTFKRTAVRGGFAASIHLRVRLCLSVGPGAVITTREERRVGSVVKARGITIDELGVDLGKDLSLPLFGVPDRVARRGGFVVGGGTYSAKLRVRDWPRAPERTAGIHRSSVAATEATPESFSIPSEDAVT